MLILIFIFYQLLSYLIFQQNVKISDYGISKFATPYGLKAMEGTPGYRAPEVIRGTSTYNTQVCCKDHSFGNYSQGAHCFS